MFEPRDHIEPMAYMLLAIGTLGDWISTRLGLSLGFVEGNPIARGFMASGAWIQVDFTMVLVCILLPLLVTRFINSKTGKFLLGFPLLAGLLKCGVVVWNLNLILV